MCRRGMFGVAVACTAAMLFAAVPAVAQCGPGSHWVDGCAAGVDNWGWTGALVGIDQDLDCVRDMNLVLHGPTTVNRTASMDDSVNFPGTRLIDGHLDVIDTEIVSMNLTAVGATLRAGAGTGAGPDGLLLKASKGVIAELLTDDTRAQSRFEVYFELDMGGGMYLYNHDPLIIMSIIDRVPPYERYIHPVVCLFLYDHPTGGNHLRNLVTAWHSTIDGDLEPPFEEGACCQPDGTCLENVIEFDCYADGGEAWYAATSCSPDPCLDDECLPLPDANGCEDVQCPQPLDECLPVCVNFDPNTGAIEVVECECMWPDRCHVDLPPAAPVDPCTDPGNGEGTVDLPPNCGYVSPQEVHEIIAGLPPGATIELDPIHQFFTNVTRQPGGTLGGEVETFESELQLELKGTGDLEGWHRTLTLSDVNCEVHTGPRNPGDPVQTFPNQMYSLSGDLGVTSDPDFETLTITAGEANGMPSPGETTLTELPSGDFAVDSFFDITYQIDFTGTSTSNHIPGAVGSNGGTIHVQTVPLQQPMCVGVCPDGEECVEEVTLLPDNTLDICCRCEPIDDCVPTTTQLDCIPYDCPDITEVCVPYRIRGNVPSSTFPPAGTDVLTDTTGYMVLRDPQGAESTYFIEQGTEPENLTVVERQEPVCNGVDPCTIEQEIVQMNFDSNDGMLKVSTRLSAVVPMPSSGQTIGYAPGIDFPAESFFDVYVEVDIGPPVSVLGLYNDALNPIRVTAYDVISIPPYGTPFISEPGMEIELLEAGGLPSGWRIIEVFHVPPPPPPPDWRVIECRCLGTDDCQIQYDAATQVPWCAHSCPAPKVCNLEEQPSAMGTEFWCECKCLCGDLDGSGGRVNLSDFSAFQLCFGLRAPTAQCPPDLFDCADLDRSGWINLTDFSTFQLLFGTESSNSPPWCP